MKQIKLLFIFLFSFNLFFANAHAADPATNALKKALKNQKAQIVDYNSGCPTCVKEMQSRPKVKLDSKDNNQQVDLTLLSEKEVGNLFKELASNEDIPFGYPMDGCYARAQAMAEIMEQKGIICGKAFVEGRLIVDSKEFGQITWGYHVAPVVMVKVGNKNVPYVIDPSLFDKPVPFEDWRNKMIANPKATKSSEYFTNRFAYDPDDKFTKKDHLDEEIIDDYQQTNKNYARNLQMMRMQKKNAR